MKKPDVCLYLLIAGILPAFAVPLRAQSWDELRGIKPGDRISVTDTAGRELKGTFTSVSSEALSLPTGNNEVAIERARVRRVRIRSNSRRVRNAVIGAAIGVAIGVTVDQTLGTRLRNEAGESGRAITYITPIGVFGAIGAALPANRTIYRAP
jgi:hypothetical protein